MAIIFTWDPILFAIVGFIFFSSIWVFRDITLILWARSAIKREPTLKFTKLLLVIGIFLLFWNIISFFLPRVAIDFSSLPDESDFFMANLIYYLYSIIPTFLSSILGVALVLFFYNISTHHNRKYLIGPIIFLIGNIIHLCFLTIFYSILLSIDWFDIASLETIETLIDVEAIAYIIIYSIFVVGFFFVFIYSIYKNNALLIMYFGLYFASLLFSLFRGINYALIEFYPW